MSSSEEDIWSPPSDPDPLRDKYYKLMKNSLKAKREFEWRFIGQERGSDPNFRVCISISELKSGQEYGFESDLTFVEDSDQNREKAFDECYQKLLAFLAEWNSN